MVNQNPNPVSTLRIFVILAAILFIGIALGLLVFPIVGNPQTIASILMFVSGLLVLFSLRL
jgi:zinc transporter ZupT